jgi:hypothetical protein
MTRCRGEEESEERPLERPRYRWEVMIELILKKWDVKLWTGFCYLKLGPVNTVINLQVP